MRTRFRIEKEAGQSFAEIAAKYKVAVSTARGVCLRYDTQKSAKSRPRSGRPKKISDRHERHIWREIGSDPLIPISKLVAIACPDVSIWTLRRWLKTEGILHSVCLQRPYLTQEVAEKRFAFALRHRDKPLSYWKRVLFSDESTVDRGCGTRAQWAFRRKGQLPPFILDAIAQAAFD